MLALSAVSKSQILCFCNNVPKERVVNAIREGAHSLSDVYDKTGAGVGPCGGTCCENIKILIAQNNSSTSMQKPLWEPPLELVEAISLFNRRYYWETHEVLEKLWLNENGPPKLFYQGVIQAAASLYHVLNSNPKGLIKLAQDSIDKLKKYSPYYHSIPVDPLVESLETYIQQAKDIMGGIRTGFDYDRLPQIIIGQGNV